MVRPSTIVDHVTRRRHGEDAPSSRTPAMDAHDTGDTFDPARDYMECCGQPDGRHAPYCDNLAPVDGWNVTGCRVCDELRADCPEHAAQVADELAELVDDTARHPDHDGLRARHLDRWTCELCPPDDDPTTAATAPADPHGCNAC